MYGILILCVLVNVYKFIYILNYDMFVVDFCVDFVFGDVFGVEVFGGVVDGDFFCRYGLQLYEIFVFYFNQFVFFYQVVGKLFLVFVCFQVEFVYVFVFVFVVFDGVFFQGFGVGEIYYIDIISIQNFVIVVIVFVCFWGDFGFCFWVIYYYYFYNLF